jgi:hypothetical protein
VFPQRARWLTKKKEKRKNPQNQRQKQKNPKKKEKTFFGAFKIEGPALALWAIPLPDV